MIFERAHLLKRLDEREAAAKEVALVRHRDALKRHRDAVQEWKAMKGPALQVLLETLDDKINRGGVITSEDVVALTRYSDNRLLFSGSTDEPVEPQGPWLSREQEAFRDFLNLIEDEKVSSSALRDAGFRNLRTLI
jgi:hypothetical protein